MGREAEIGTVPSRPAVDIEFQNISYFVRCGRFNTDFKQILRSINGKFSSGNLTAILGSSGAGKSTLLNILAGYVSSGVRGTIKVNDAPRDMKLFNRISTYIMQDDLLQPLLTVKETMMIAANLKLSSDISQKEKEQVVIDVTKIIGLTAVLDTRTDNLSGGQRKRLSIALELVNNPPVIFLDEPTTGLDNVAMKQCIELLKSLTRQGRTIVCTIHQPSDSLFNLFDQVYFMSDGRCIYDGSVPNLVPFLSSAGFSCPTTYSPADYIIELTHTNHDNVAILSEISNARHEKLITAASQELSTEIDTVVAPFEEHNYNFPTSFWTQFRILLRKNFVQLSRNRTSLFIQSMHHICSGLIIGSIFYGVGNNASLVYTNFRFLVSIMVFFCYTYIMGPILVFPLEVRILKREYFNRWYSLKAYFIALALTPLPAMMLFGFIFIIIVYVMTNQPMDFNRFMWFTLIILFTSIASQGYGLAVGSVFNQTNGTFMGPVTVTPLALLCIYGMGHSQQVSPFMKVVMHFSFLRSGLEGLCSALYNEREFLECTDDIYCHYSDSTLFMRDVGMDVSSYKLQFVGIFFFTILHMYVAYLFLRYRLSREFSNRLFSYARNVLKYKL